MQSVVPSQLNKCTRNLIKWPNLTLVLIWHKSLLKNSSCWYIYIFISKSADVSQTHAWSWWWRLRVWQVDSLQSTICFLIPMNMFCYCAIMYIYNNIKYDNGHMLIIDSYMVWSKTCGSIICVIWAPHIDFQCNCHVLDKSVCLQFWVPFPALIHLAF